MSKFKDKQSRDNFIFSNEDAIKVNQYRYNILMNDIQELLKTSKQTVNLKVLGELNYKAILEAIHNYKK